MNLDTRQKAFFLITLKINAKSADQMYKHLPHNIQSEMLARFADLKVHDADTIRHVATTELRRLARNKSLNYLSEVHNDWILDLLQTESPEMIATILRYLPAERVHFIMEAMPAKALEQLPKISETFNIPRHLVDLLKQKFESLFTVHKTYTVDQDFEYEYFCLLKPHQIGLVFLELGYREIALALKSIPQEARKSVLQRISPSAKECVEYYFKTTQDCANERVHLAQDRLMQQDLAGQNSDFFVKELGFVTFAQTVLAKDWQDLKMIQHKLAKIEAQALMSSVDTQIAQNTEISVLQPREEILKAVNIVIGRV